MARRTWTVQVRNEAGQWVDIIEPTRCSVALRLYTDTEQPKALAMNGRRLRMQSTSEQLDLFGEEEPN